MEVIDGFSVTRRVRRREGYTLFRGNEADDQGAVLLLHAERPSPALRERFEHELGLRDELDPDWAARPVALVQHEGHATLVLEDCGGTPLDCRAVRPHDIDGFLRTAIGITTALRQAHERNLVHKDLKPENVLFDPQTGRAHLTGFGVASRLPREHQTPEPPETIAGTLAYMAPEQTGRMNRSVDSRSDLYSLGVTLYQLLTRVLPFTASEPIEWVHCHVARRPPAPIERDANIPRQLSDIVMKLLAKTAEERYQTAAGLERDLRRCLSEWQAHGRVEPFALARHDVPDRLVIPEKLYGRESERAILLSTWERVALRGTPELLLVSGYSGVGKSSLVNELLKNTVPPRGFFASGKFDEHKRTIPYSTLGPALAVLIRQILVEPEELVSEYRNAILAAVGPNGQLLVDLVPELELVIGEQPGVVALPSQQAQNRYHAVFTRFLAVFARQEHPLALFLDDLQWLDPASLKLFEHLASAPELRHLLLIGAYRDNEVSASHPLMPTLDAIRRSGISVQDVVLSPLGANDVDRLVADTVHHTRGRAEPLARLVYEKTGGNPFFAIQFLGALYGQGLLRFDKGRWMWDLARIKDVGFTDNVVELMLGKLRQLSETTQQALKALACLGDGTNIETLARALSQRATETQVDLWDAVAADLLLRTADTYAFAHDRIQEAAYRLIPEEQRAAEHLRIGRLLLSEATQEGVDDRIFDIVHHFNRGLGLVTDAQEKARIRELNVRAGRKAKAASASASARNYFAQAAELLGADAWAGRYDETLSLFLDLSECEYLLGNFERAEELFNAILDHARSRPDRARVHRLRVLLYQLAGRYEDAVRVGLDGLALFGVTPPESARALRAAVEQELREFSTNLGERQLADLVDAPAASDADARAIIGLVAELVAPMYITQSPLSLLFVLRAVNLALSFGNSSDSSFCYFAYAILRVGLFDDVPLAFELAELALCLNEKLEDTRRRGMLLHLYATLIHGWRHHLKTSLPLLERAFIDELNVGDLVYANYNAHTALWLRFAAGQTLSDAVRGSKRYLEFARASHSELVYDQIRLQEQFVACLQGATRGPTSFDDDTFDEQRSLTLATESGGRSAVAYHYVLKQLAAVIYERFDEAHEYSRKTEEMLLAITGQTLVASQHFFHALTLTALWHDASAVERDAFAVTLERIQSRFRVWAEHGPENFTCMHALVAAELARISGRESEAMRAYERSIGSARENGFAYVEALACERAAKFYQELGIEGGAHGYLRAARSAYLRWGALGKVQQFDRAHPGFEDSAPSSTDSIGRSIEQLDVPGVVKASQAVSGEIVPQKLVEKLLAIVLDQAGAERAVLVLPHAKGFTIEAEARTQEGGVTVRLVQRPPAPKDLPESILRYVVRTQETVIVDDASAAGPYAADEYVRRKRARSLLCLPLVKQSKLVGVLYLENNLTAGAFTRDRIALLGVLASQAAISLENARLYRDLVDERSRLQAVIQQVPAALLITEAPSGRIIIANDRVEPILHRKYRPVSSVGEYKEYVGFYPDGRRYAPHEWPLARSLLEGEVVDGEEIRVLWADGNTGWISVNSGPIRDREGKITASVAIFSDVTERKRKEEALRTSEARFSIAFHDSPTPMAIARLKDASFVDANERCLQTFGFAQEEFIGHSVEELGIASSGEMEKFRTILDELGSFQEVEFVGVTKSGDPRTLLLSQETLELDGEMCALMTFVDVTERKQVEAQLRQSQKMEAIGSLAGGVAHDFNNLLTVINGSAELLMLQMEASHPNYGLCESILETGERAAELTRKLLMFSRKEVAEPKDWNLNSIVVGMKGMLRRLIEEDVDLTTNLARDCGPIRADRSQVEQVILNLVVNARDAMPRGGKIVIETGNVVLERGAPETILEVASGSYVMLAVKDTGTGIVPEARAKIFEPFFTTKEVGHGSGLGLAVVYGIVKQSGGSISVTSEPGVGTTLRVYFQRAAEAAEEARPTERPKPYHGTERVLLAEDELELRRFVTRALEFQGYRVTAVKNGRRALALLKDAKQEFDLVVTDLVMPDMGGRELAKHMADEHIEVPILFTSGYSEDLARWVKADQVDFLPKPFRASELARKIRDILDRLRSGSSAPS